MSTPPRKKGLTLPLALLHSLLSQKGRGYGSISFGLVLLTVFFAFHSSLMELPSPVWAFLLGGGIISFLLGILFLFLEERILRERVREQERLFEFLLEYIPDLIYFKDRESRFVWASLSHARHLGLEHPEDLLGKTDFDFFSKPHAEEAFFDEQRIMKTGEPIIGKIEQETWPDGRTNWVHTTKIPLRDEKGEIIGIVGISRDITELKEKEETLERERTFLRDILESVQDGISVLERNLTILMANPFMERMYEDSSPLVGKKCYEAYQGRTSPCLFCPTIPAMEQGEKVTHVVPYIHQGEVKGWLELTAYPFRDKEGHILGVIECVKDITERVRAEDTLRESERKFRILAELSPAAIVIYQDNRYIYCNRMAEILTGYTQEKILSMPLLAFIHPEDQERARRNAEARQRGEKAEDEYELRIVRKDGAVRWTFLRGATIHLEGRFAGLAVLLDITERKIMEEHILRLNQVLKAVRNVNQLITKEKERQRLAEGVCRELMEGCGYSGVFVALSPQREEETLILSLGFGDISPLLNKLCQEFKRDSALRRTLRVGKDCNGHPLLVSLLRPEEDLFVVPLEWSGTYFGILGVSLPSPSIGGEEEEALLFELSQDLSFALYSIKLEKEQEEIYRALEESEAQYADLFYNMVEGFALREMIFDEEGNPVDYRFLKVNPAFEHLTGLRKEDVIGKTAREVLPTLEPFWIETYGRVAQGGRPVTFEHYAEPLKRYYSITVYSPRPGQFATIFNDITERKLAEERIRYLTFHDVLTGLYNRTFFEQEANHLDTPENLPLSIIMGDLNGLKLINDAFGHAMGDELLRQAARILEEICAGRGIVARLGGDEFVVLLPRTSSTEVQALGEKIQEAFHRTFVESIPLSISLGYGTKTESKESLSEILRIAENWMYQRKLIERTSLHNRVLQAFRASLQAVTQETEEHSQRIRDLALRLGKALGLSQRELDELSLLAEFHDIGKITIPRTILEKSGPLNEEEWSIVKKHPEVGFRITQSIWELSSIATYILFHHERFDGQGYPRGLKGENIPLLSRIIAVCDAYDAMVSSRPYRRAYTKKEAMEELKRCAGTQFDPRIVEIFVKILEEDNYPKPPSL
ncbi:MAG: PAS domain S-box protein [Candidatus Caldatribacteriaceae bacterium]